MMKGVLESFGFKQRQVNDPDKLHFEKKLTNGEMKRVSIPNENRIFALTVSEIIQQSGIEEPMFMGALKVLRSKAPKDDDESDLN
jgi:hypothetical protein